MGAPSRYLHLPLVSIAVIGIGRNRNIFNGDYTACSWSAVDGGGALAIAIHLQVQ
jgi:hypothetical protein